MSSGPDEDTVTTVSACAGWLSVTRATGVPLASPTRIGPSVSNAEMTTMGAQVGGVVGTWMNQGKASRCSAGHDPLERRACVARDDRLGVVERRPQRRWRIDLARALDRCARE